jgi:hypothetical protein
MVSLSRIEADFGWILYPGERLILDGCLGVRLILDEFSIPE